LFKFNSDFYLTVFAVADATLVQKTKISIRHINFK